MVNIRKTNRDSHLLVTTETATIQPQMKYDYMDFGTKLEAELENVESTTLIKRASVSIYS
jgi:hypothetical protein